MMTGTATDWETWLNKYFVPLLAAALLVNAGALFIPILEPDGALYATIAKTMARSGDLVNLMAEGKDWLDKPHFPFWMAAISMRIFGVNAFAYKLPALLFWLTGAWYTFQFSLRLYGRPVAQLAVLIYVTAAHLVISNNDVRAEPYLTGLVIGSVFHFYKASMKERWVAHLLAGALMAACAIMTKGLFVMVTIGGGFVLDWVAGGRWKQFLRPRWWSALLLTLLFTAPEIICLYLQFDLHPEKWVFGRQGVSGLHFFFWDSQFGRFFNTGPIKGQGDVFFYFHTSLWAFLPWSLLLYAAVIWKCRRLRKPAPFGDLICTGAALISFAMFSLSKFQLPHYLNILFPFFAILTAEWFFQVLKSSAAKTIRIIQNSITVLLPLLVLALTWFFHGSGWALVMISVLLLAIAIPFIFRGKDLAAAFGRSFSMALLVYAFVNFIFYPAMLKYQAGTQAGRAVAMRPKEFPERSAVLYEAPVNFSFEFYAPGDVQKISIDSLQNQRPLTLFIPLQYIDSLRLKGYAAEPRMVFSNFHISQLTGEFINEKTRARALETWVLATLH